MSFSTVAEFYDLVNGEAYEPYAEMLKTAFKFADIEVREVLDLGCGTGGISALLSDDGFDMVALDVSPEMLNVARERNFGKNTLLLCQDMREFELFGTVQAVFSSFDCLNYITEKEELKKVFSLVRNYLESGGVFVFDVNTEHRYKEVFNGKNYVFEFDDSFTVWRSFYSGSDGICEFVLDTFTENDDGTYDRACEEQVQKFHSREDILDCAVGFTLVSVTGGKGFDGCNEPEKEYYIFKRD